MVSSLLQSTLDEKIKNICPINGMSFGKIDDKTTWKISFKPEATPEQRAAALLIIENFVWNEEEKDRAEKEQSSKRYSADPIYKFAFYLFKKEQPNATFRDFVTFLSNL